jgi:hypothetical protein
MELWQLPVAILLGILIGWVTAGMGLTFLMRFAYGLMNSAKIKTRKESKDK